MSGARDWMLLLPFHLTPHPALSFPPLHTHANPVEVVVLVMFEGWKNTMNEIHFHSLAAASPPLFSLSRRANNSHFQFSLCVRIRISLCECMHECENFGDIEVNSALNGIFRGERRMLAISARNLRNLLAAFAKICTAS